MHDATLDDLDRKNLSLLDPLRSALDVSSENNGSRIAITRDRRQASTFRSIHLPPSWRRDVANLKGDRGRQAAESVHAKQDGWGVAGDRQWEAELAAGRP